MVASLVITILTCPIVPAYLLGPSALENPAIRLLSADGHTNNCLGDSPEHYLTHRYCWDYTQRLLLEVLLAHPWTQTSRTVEGLLLLSEWLAPYPYAAEQPSRPRRISSVKTELRGRLLVLQ